MTYEASFPLKRVLMGTKTPPATWTPKAAITHSHVLGAQIPIRSPGLTPVSISAFADLKISSLSSIKDNWNSSSTRA